MHEVLCVGQCATWHSFEQYMTIVHGHFFDEERPQLMHGTCKDKMSFSMFSGPEPKRIAAAKFESRVDFAY